MIKEKLNRMNTPNNEFIIEFYRERKVLSFDKYSMYSCHIDFYNNINQKILSLICSESELFNSIQEINAFITNFYEIYDTIVHFGNNENMVSHFIHIGIKYPYNNSPIEDDDTIVISIYQTNILNKNNLRLFFEADSLFLENMMYNMFQLLEDLPYLDKIINTSVEDYINSFYYGYGE